MKVRIDRTKMAMSGSYCSYDGVVPASEVEHADKLSHFIVRDGINYVPFADAIRPAYQFDMPRGVERYDAWMAHESIAAEKLVAIACGVYPELCGMLTMPRLWIEVSPVYASHATRHQDFNQAVTA